MPNNAINAAGYGERWLTAAGQDMRITTVRDAHTAIRRIFRTHSGEEPLEQTDTFRFLEEDERVIRDGGRPATAQPLLLGITKASLSTDEPLLGTPPRGDVELNTAE